MVKAKEKPWSVTYGDGPVCIGSAPRPRYTFTMASTLERHRSKLLELMPPPRYLTMPSVGVDISDRSIKFLELIRVGGDIRPGRYGELPLPPGAVEGGSIQNSQAVSAALAVLRKKYHFEFIRASLPEEKAYLFRTDVPAAPPRDIRTNLEFQLEENVPLSPAEAVFDYDIIGPGEKSGFFEAAVTVVPASFASAYLDAFKKAGLTPLSLEIEAQAIARAVVPRHDAGASMVIDFGRTRTGISIISRGAVAFTSTVDIGGDPIDAVIRRLPGGDADIDRIKNERGFLRTLDNADLVESMAGVIAALKDEINRHVVYWNTHEEKHEGRPDRKHDPVGAMMLCGGNANLAGLAEHLSSVMRMPVSRANVWTNVFSFDAFIPDLSASKSLGFATAVGLALREDL
jgi:type IV pilus assembly protein PilM